MTTVEASAGVKATFFASSPRECKRLAEAVESFVPGSEVDVGTMLAQLAPHEASLLAWLDGSEQNRQRFLEDPVAALESAGLGIGDATLKQMRAASEALAGAARSTPDKEDEGCIRGARRSCPVDAR